MWKEQNNSLEKTFVFKTFKDAITFVNQVAEVAEANNHHPGILINYNKISLTLTTHDAGNKVTALDRRVAKQVDELL